MAVVPHHHLTPRHQYVRRAWIALAFVPMGIILTTFIAFAGGEAGDNAYRLAGAVLGVLALAPAAVSVFFAFLAERAGEHSAGIALVVSMVVAVVLLLALPLLVVSGEAVFIAAGVCAVGMATVALFRSRKVIK